MSHHLLRTSSVVTSQLRNDIPDFYVGSVVEVHYRIKEGTKERVQVFAGLVINRHGGESLDATFTVLKNATGAIKVDRTFPLHTPAIEKVVVLQLKRARKANLRFLHNVKDPIKTVRSKTVKVK